jgi:hypothetical protein
MMACFSEARVVMETPRRYLSQLCKHFEHKLPVTLEESSGSIAFPSGLCTLRAEPEALVMRVAGEEAVLPQLEDVVARHLLRFAFRAPPEIIWVKNLQPTET